VIGAAESAALFAAGESAGGSFSEKLIIAAIGVAGVIVGIAGTWLIQRRIATRAERREREAERTAVRSAVRILARQLRDIKSTLRVIKAQWPAIKDLALEVDAQDAKIIARESVEAYAALAEAQGVMKSVRMRADLHRREGNRPPDDEPSRELLELASTTLATSAQALENLDVDAPATPAAHRGRQR
jgi:hypothetical protein